MLKSLSKCDACMREYDRMIEITRRDHIHKCDRLRTKIKDLESEAELNRRVVHDIDVVYSYSFEFFHVIYSGPEISGVVVVKEFKTMIGDFVRLSKFDNKLFKIDKMKHTGGEQLELTITEWKE